VIRQLESDAESLKLEMCLIKEKKVAVSHQTAAQAHMRMPSSGSSRLARHLEYVSIQAAFLWKEMPIRDAARNYACPRESSPCVTQSLNIWYTPLTG
jgi:hypothetical protein